MFFNFHLLGKGRCKAFLSVQVESPFFSHNIRQRERKNCSPAQLFWRRATPFLRQNVVSPAKLVSIDLLGFAETDFAEFPSGRKNFKTAAKSVGRNTSRKQLDIRSERKTENHIKSLPNRAVGRVESFSKTLAVDDVF